LPHDLQYSKSKLFSTLQLGQITFCAAVGGGETLGLMYMGVE